MAWFKYFCEFFMLFIAAVAFLADVFLSNFIYHVEKF